jgi:predicted 3-demethylubiquinone-9 3-methyltransferase (glyoxalase superfamily)
MSKISPFLWFDANAEEAFAFYETVFPNIKRTKELRWPEGTPNAGKMLVLSGEIEGQNVTLMNGGPGHPLTEAFSFVVNCDTQEEIDRYWDKFLAAGATTMACGWLKDHFGLCWQITPTRIGEWVSKPKAMAAMMKMIKLDIPTLEAAAAEE